MIHTSSANAITTAPSTVRLRAAIGRVNQDGCRPDGRSSTGRVPGRNDRRARPIASLACASPTSTSSPEPGRALGWSCSESRAQSPECSRSSGGRCLSSRRHMAEDSMLGHGPSEESTTGLRTTAGGCLAHRGSTVLSRSSPRPPWSFCFILLGAAAAPCSSSSCRPERYSCWALHCNGLSGCLGQTTEAGRPAARSLASLRRLCAAPCSWPSVGQRSEGPDATKITGRSLTDSVSQRAASHGEGRTVAPTRLVSRSAGGHLTCPRRPAPHPRH